MILSRGKYQSTSAGRTPEKTSTIPFGPCQKSIFPNESRLPITVYFISTNLDVSESHFTLSCVSPYAAKRTTTTMKGNMIRDFFQRNELKITKAKYPHTSDMAIILFVMRIPRKSMNNMRYFSPLFILLRVSGSIMRRYPAT